MLFVSAKVITGNSKNTIRNAVTTVRSFFTSECQPVTIKRGRIFEPQLPTNEHEFNQSDLQKMFNIGGVRDKAILSTAVSLGWGISDFLDLERDFIEGLIKRARSENQQFINFDSQRKKTDVRLVGILTPEALDTLEAWLKYSEKYKSKTRWLWASTRRGRLQVDSVNDILRRLVQEAGLVTTGKVHFHLLRKFLFNTLSSYGLNSFESKFVIGKKISASDLTYLQRLKQDAFKKYQEAYPNFSLIKVNAEDRELKEAYSEIIGENRRLRLRTDAVVEGYESRIKKLEDTLEGFQTFIANQHGIIREKGTKP